MGLKRFIREGRIKRDILKFGKICEPGAWPITLDRVINQRDSNLKTLHTLLNGNVRKSGNACCPSAPSEPSAQAYECYHHFEFAFARVTKSEPTIVGAAGSYNDLLMRSSYLTIKCLSAPGNFRVDSGTSQGAHCYPPPPRP